MSPEQEEYIRRAEREYLQSLTIEQSVRQFLSMCAEFKEELEKTEHLYRAARLEHLRDLQEKLRRCG